MNAKGNETRFGYEDLKRPAAIIFPDDTRYDFKFSDDGRLENEEFVIERDKEHQVIGIKDW